MKKAALCSHLCHWNHGQIDVARSPQLLGILDDQLEKLNNAVTQVARQYPDVHLLMRQPGVGAVTALAFVLTIGDVRRFPRGEQVASYLGLIPREYSSGGKQRMGHQRDAENCIDAGDKRRPLRSCVQRSEECESAAAGRLRASSAHAGSGHQAAECRSRPSL